MNKRIGIREPANQIMDLGKIAERTGDKVPLVLCIVGAPASGKDAAIDDILRELAAKAIKARRLKRVTTRPYRGPSDTKRILSRSYWTILKRAQHRLVAPLNIAHNKQDYAYLPTCFLDSSVDLSIAEPNTLQLIPLKRILGKNMHTILLVANREYRKFLLQKRGSEGSEEIERRLDVGDGQLLLSLIYADKNNELISKYISPEIMAIYKELGVSETSEMARQKLENKIGSDLSKTIIETLFGAKQRDQKNNTTCRRRRRYRKRRCC